MNDPVKDKLLLLNNQMHLTNEMCYQVIETLQLFTQHTEAIMNEITVALEGLDQGAPYLND